ncbi:hypothetical protein Poli38472_007022 [Pythium oligandrum]|uniref:NADP-dependent oxidoreductase domain-containing protein n=1 Tax=Pythium oligandrum TaxID=41045 RepID=A0A8K1FGN1_PYTOL|nr:hypothetical protein Poli38472_007022 [Pythium oligandrum]|eukprot:TMW58877.1 hypothetical protein Poli38472_007022 [Pythium oligandrum]
MDFVNLYKKYKFGLTTWSPLKFGLLTGKYGSGIPEGSRLSEQYHVNLLNGEFEEKLALAWVTSNERVSTTIIGATSFKQLEENLKALEVVPKLTEEVKARIDSIVTYKLKLPTHEPSATHRHKYL